MSVCRPILGREQYRREMRAALHVLQHRLGQCHNGHSGVRVVGKAGPKPSTERPISGKLSQKLRGFYTIFTSCVL